MSVVVQRGTVRELHGLDALAAVGDAPEVWWMQPTDGALVLGSRQTPDMVDTDECERLGLDVVRRRSGGGAVLIVPAQLVWIDIVAPPGAAPDDVRRSMVWAGDLWERALGVDGLSVHTGSMVCTAWCNLVCFAGLGPGEVSSHGRKLVGLSQRRTRNGVRIQGTLYTSAPAIDITKLLRGDVPTEPLPEIATLAVDAETLVARLAELVPGSA